MPSSLIRDVDEEWGICGVSNVEFLGLGEEKEDIRLVASMMFWRGTWGFDSGGGGSWDEACCFIG